MREYVHVSFDIVDQFEPRIPKTCAIGEDQTIKRICVSDEILYALNALAESGKTLAVMQRLGLPLTMHAYYLESDHVMAPDVVQRYVPDADINHESWILDSPIHVHRIDYEIMNPEFYKLLDDPDPFSHLILKNAQLQRVPECDNVELFMRHYHVKEQEQLGTLIRKYGYSMVVCNLSEELLAKKERMEKERKRRKNHESICSCI